MRYDRRMARTAIVVLLGLLIVACDEGEGVRTVPTTGTVPGADATATPGEATATPMAEPATPTQAVMPNPSPTPTTDSACVQKETRSPVIAACEALADRFGRSPAEVLVASVTPKQWSNSCLGLAGPEEVCAQVITPGYEVVLELDGAMYTYHTNEGTGVRLDEDAATG